MDRHYVYGIVSAGQGQPVLPREGVTGAPVVALREGQLAAVASPVGAARIRSSRAELAAHERVVEEIAAETTILPLQFGVVMASDRSVIDDLLAPNMASFCHLVADLAGKAEYRLKAAYVDDAGLRDAVASNPSIKKLQRRIGAGSGMAQYHDRIRLGEMVASALAHVKAADAAEVVGRLGRHASSSVTAEATQPEIAVKAAFLVPRDASQRFDAAVNELANDLTGRMSLQLVGPLAPWDFVGGGGD